MKIGLNATCFNDRPSGARQRFVGIYGELARRLPDTEFVVYEPSDCRVGSWFNGASNVSVRRTPLPSEGRVKRYLGGLRYWPLALASEQFSLFEGFHLPLVSSPGARTLLTIHDIRALHSQSPTIERVLFRSIFGSAIKAVDHLVTVSEAIKDEISGLYPGIPISVIYNGLNAEDFSNIPECELSIVRRKFALPAEFVLAVGHFERRKNYLRLIDAVARLRDRGRSCFLLIVGNDGGEKALIAERIKATNLAGNAMLLSGLSDLEVRCMYKLCNMLVFPSSYEGFGIPVIEAMAAGCPMAISDIAVFREITQDRSAYFSPHDTEAMAIAIDNVLTSGSERARLTGYGAERVQDFSFHNVAGQMERLYKSLT